VRAVDACSGLVVGLTVAATDQILYWDIGKVGSVSQMLFVLSNIFAVAFAFLAADTAR
jgi:hypothetical protein